MSHDYVLIVDSLATTIIHVLKSQNPPRMKKVPVIGFVCALIALILCIVVYVDTTAAVSDDGNAAADTSGDNGAAVDDGSDRRKREAEADEGNDAASVGIRGEGRDSRYFQWTELIRFQFYFLS